MTGRTWVIMKLSSHVSYHMSHVCHMPHFSLLSHDSCLMAIACLISHATCLISHCYRMPHFSLLSHASCLMSITRMSQVFGCEGVLAHFLGSIAPRNVGSALDFLDLRHPCMLSMVPTMVNRNAAED